MSFTLGDPLTAALLERIQQRVPLMAQPFHLLAGELGCPPADVFDRLHTLRDRGVVREISGVFDATRLGYSQTLVAMAVPAEGLTAAAELAASHPGVSHCYSREHEMNLWFTLACSPASTLGVEGTVEWIARHSGAARWISLPTQKRFKLVAPGGRTTFQPPLDALPHTPRVIQLTEPLTRAVRALQQDLPLVDEPFAPLAEAAGMNADELLVAATQLLTSGAMRRYAAAIAHRHVGLEANVLVVWDVLPALADHAGQLAARSHAVSHCYQRPARPGWPYTLYTMIHGRRTTDCLATIGSIAAALGDPRREELWTLHEYKKRRCPLLGDEEQQWERGCDDHSPPAGDNSLTER